MSRLTGFLTIILATVVLFTDTARDNFNALNSFWRWVWVAALVLAISAGLAVWLTPIVWQWGNYFLTNF